MAGGVACGHTKSLVSFFSHINGALSKQLIQGMIGGHGMGGAGSHIKAFWLSHSLHQSEFCTEGLLGQHAYVCMLGRTLIKNTEGLQIQYLGLAYLSASTVFMLIEHKK